MSVFSWLKSRVTASRRAEWLYRRGMVQAKLHQNEKAIADYTAVIDMPDASGDLRAMALYNRALVHHATGNAIGAIQDLNRILEMAEAAGDVKTEARRKLVRMDRESNRIDARDAAVNPNSQVGTHARNAPKAAGKQTEQR